MGASRRAPPGALRAVESGLERLGQHGARLGLVRPGKSKRARLRAGWILVGLLGLALVVLVTGWRATSRVEVRAAAGGGNAGLRVDGAGQNGPVAQPQRRRRRKRRKHLHEICPHLVKTVGQPYANPYVVQVAAPAASKIPELTSVKQGDMPVILSVPHGASAKDSTFSWQARNLPERSGATAVFNASDFQSRLSRVSTDTNTQQLATDVAAILRKKYKRKPYIVQARFHRKFVDVNRRVNGSKACCEEMWPKCTAVADFALGRDGKVDRAHASKVNTARQVYDAYHGAIIDAINEIARAHPGKAIFVLDIHAQKAVSDEELGITAEEMANAVIAGTQDGRLVKDRAALYAPGGLLRRLSQAGIGLYPPSNDVPDHPKYNGGHLVAEYGFNNTLGAEISAVQLEFGFNLRVKTKPRAQAAAALADALHHVTA